MLTRESLFIILAFAILGALLLGVSALLGWLVKLIFSLSRNYGLCVGYVLAGLSLFIALSGCTIGFARFRVQHVELAFEDLPAEFDGYRIVHLTDAHLGSFHGREKLLHKSIDAILSQDADLVVFTGDLQNNRPSELEPFVTELSRLKARDGVFAVLGNHDYGYPQTPESPIGVRRVEESSGWQVLVNEHVAIERDSSRIILGGMDNDGDGVHFPRRGNVRQTLSTVAEIQSKMCTTSNLVGNSQPVTSEDFVILLEHDPTSWRRNILPNSSAQLTLSGHTHAMQFGLFGWSPSKWIYPEWRGLFTENDRKLYVSSGIGGVIPFRFGMPREIVVIELTKNII